MLSFIVQLVLMTYVSYALKGNEPGIWLNSIFHGMSIWVPFCILLIFVLLIVNITHARESRFILISIVVIAIWLRSFMLLKGFIHFGGDDGDHIAIIKFLLQGGRTPFLDLSVSEGGFNWRYGSKLTLFFHSNMAFLSALGGLPLDLPGAISVSLSTILLGIGGYALASSVLKNKRAVQLCLVLLLFNFPDFFWQFRFDPTLLLHVLLPAYLAVVVGISFSIKEFILFFVSSLAMFVTHPMSIGLILPIASYKIFNYSHLLIQKNRNKFILAFSIGLIIIILTFLNPDTLFLIFRAFSVTHLAGLTYTSMPIQIGNFVSESYLLEVFLARYTLYISFIFALGLSLLFSPWKKMKDHVFLLKMRDLIVFFVLVLVETIFIDFFVRAAAFPYFRLFPLVLTISIPIVSAVFSFWGDLNTILLFHIHRRRIFTRVTIDPQILVISLILGFLISLSFIQTAYPPDKDLNYDTLSIQELDLISDFLSQTDLNKTIILAEYPVSRYIMGLLGDWPPKTATYFSHVRQQPGRHFDPFGKERTRAFHELMYHSNVVPTLQLATNENISKICIVALHRHSGSEATWGPYYENLNSDGKIIISNPAGNIWEISIPSDKSIINIPLDNFKISTTGVKNPIFNINEDSVNFGGNFTNHHQAIYAVKNGLNLNTTKHRYLAIRYRGDNHSGQPRIRIHLTDSNSNIVELKPNIFGDDILPLTEFYDLKLLSIENIDSITLMLDSGSPGSSWPGSGTYTFHIEKIWLTNILEDIK